MMKLSDILDLDFCLFDPQVSYSGQLAFNKEVISCSLQEDILYLNANWNSNGNKYESFLEKYYYRPLEGMLHSKSLTYSAAPVILIDEKENGRVTKFSDDVFLIRMLSSLILTDLKNIDINEFNHMNLDERISYVRKAYINERKCCEDVKKNGHKSVYFETLSLFHKNEPSLNKVNFSRFLDSRISFCEKMTFLCRYLKEFLEKPLNVLELVDCFNFDKFALIACKICVDDMIDMHERENKVSSAVNYLVYYFNSIDYLREQNPKYNCKIKYMVNGLVKTIDIDELKTIYEEILSKHPEIEFGIVSDDIIGYALSRGVDEETILQMSKREFSNLLRTLLIQQQLEETDKKEIEEKISELVSLSEQMSNAFEKNRLIQQKEKMEFLMENCPVTIIKGEGTFANYYGYVYANGYVVFDVLDKNISKSYGNALYIMPFNKIKEYSNRKKMELRSNIFDDVTIILHRGDWKQKILDKLGEAIKIDESIELDGRKIDISSITSIEALEKIKHQLAMLDSKTKQALEERKRKIETLKIIDEELKQDERSDSITTSDIKDLNDEVDRLLETNETDFEKLYVFWKKKQDKGNVKRNPVVATITKLRARDENGNYCCELCNAMAFDPKEFDAHHVKPIGLGGIDNIYNTVCLCPNCHRLIHANRVTLSQQYYLLQRIKAHLHRDNPEYLQEFENLFNPNSLSDEDYLERKEEIDRNFAIDWNGFKR